MDTGSVIVLAAAAGFVAGLGVAAYFARDMIRHKRRIAYLGFVAELNLLAMQMTDERVAATLRLKAQLWQRSADVLKPHKEN